MEIAWLYLYGYLVGSVPTAYLMGRWVRGIDLRQYGSGNLGASNLSQQAGWLCMAPQGLFDVLIKGASPVWIGHYVLGLDPGSPPMLLTPALAVVGHNWSVFTRFQGGRGIAVVSGVLLALSPLLLGVFLLVFAAGWVFTRSAGVWVLAALAGLPIWALLLGQPASLSWFCLSLLMLVVLKRVLSNGGPMPVGKSRKRVVLNRLLRDRDIKHRDQWINQVPAAKKY